MDQTGAKSTFEDTESFNAMTEQGFNEPLIPDSKHLLFVISSYCLLFFFFFILDFPELYK